MSKNNNNLPDYFLSDLEDLTSANNVNMLQDEEGIGKLALDLAQNVDPTEEIWKACYYGTLTEKDIGNGESINWIKNYHNKHEEIKTTLLMNAVLCVNREKRVQIVELLLNKLPSNQVVINHKNAEGDSPLLIAIKVGNAKIVELLLNKLPPSQMAINEEVRKNEHYPWDTPLFRAIKVGNAKIVELLLNKLPSNQRGINLKNKEGDPLLLMAIKASKASNAEIAELLLKPR